MENSNQIVRKIIPVLAITGSLCGFFMSLYHMADPDVNIISLSSVFLAYLIAGTLISHLIYNLSVKAGKDIISRNLKDEAYLIKQKMYLLSLPVYIIAFILTLSMGGKYALAYAFVNGTAFLFGIVNGIFDYKNVVSQNLLYVGIIPIGLSFVYSYYSTDVTFLRNTVWFFGSMYLMAYLLLINRMKLNSILFFRNSVNVDNSRKIRIQNDILICLFYLLYLVLFNFKSLLYYVWDAILAAVIFISGIMQKILDFLLSSVGGGNVPSEKNELDLGQGTELVGMSYFLRILLLIVGAIFAVFFIIFLVKIIIKLVKLIAGKMGITASKKTKKEKILAKEYEEETEIIVDKNRFKFTHEKKKLKYSIKELSTKEGKERIRYFYGFILERLKIKEVDIAKSDAPEEILSKISRYEGGAALKEKGFYEVSEEYSKVRYGDKEPCITVDENKAKVFEKDINNIRVEKKEKMH